jgi:hypothetical protein
LYGSTGPPAGFTLLGRLRAFGGLGFSGAAAGSGGVTGITVDGFAGLGGAGGGVIRAAGMATAGAIVPIALVSPLVLPVLAALPGVGAGGSASPWLSNQPPVAASARSITRTTMITPQGRPCAGAIDSDASASDPRAGLTLAGTPLLAGGTLCARGPR